VSGPETPRRVLYLICCGSPPARDAAVLVELAQSRGWDVCVIASPDGTKWLDRPALQKLTGHPVRSDYKQPDDPDVLPPPDAIIVAPATVNTINKWAAGISDTYALGLVVEAIGKKLPLVAMPFTNSAQAAHPAFGRSIAELRSWGVTVLYGDDIYRLHAPGTGDRYVHQFPWHLTLDALDAIEPGRSTAR